MPSNDVYCAMVGALGGTIFGYSTGIIGGLSTSLTCNFFPDPSQSLIDSDPNVCGSSTKAGQLTSAQSFYQGLLTAEILLGAFAGAFLGPFVANRYGRRIGCLTTGLVCIVTSIALALVTSYWPLILVRTLQGIAVGFSSTVCPLYVSEMATPDKKGRLGTVFQIFICGSILVAQIVNYALNQTSSITIPAWNWHLQLGLCALPGVLLVVLSQLMPESHSFLAKASALTSAINPAAAAGGDDESPTTSAAAATPSAAGQWGLLFSGSGLRWVGVAIILSIANQLTGINGIIFYAPSIFKTQFPDGADALVLTFTAVGGWNFLSVFLSFFLVDRFSRKSLLIVTLTLMTIGTLMLGFTDKDNPILPSIAKSATLHSTLFPLSSSHPPHLSPSHHTPCPPLFFPPAPL